MNPTQTPGSSTIKLRIDTLAGRGSQLFSTTIVLLLGAIFLLASYAPDGYSTEFRSIVDCSQFQSQYTIPNYVCNAYDPQTNPTLGVEVTDIGHRDKFLVLEISPFQVSSQDHISISTPVTVNVYTLEPQEKKGALLTTVNKDLEFDCSLSQEEPCSFQEVYTIPKIEAKGYYFTITFSKAQEISSQISSFQISTKSLSITYRNFKFAVKFIYVAITALTLLVHFLKMSGLKKEFFTLEQKLIPFIAPSLLTINEPFTIHLFEGVMYSWGTIFSFSLFTALLMWLWINVIDNLAGSDSSLIERSSIFAKIYTPIYFVIVFITYGTLGHLALKDPLFNFHSNENLYFMALKYALFGMLTLGLVWMGSKTVRIWKRMNELNERENAFFWFSVFFILSHFYFIARGNLYPFSYDTPGLILFNGISTLYVFSSSYLFLPTEEGIAQANYLKKYKNPAVKNSYKDLEDSVDHTAKNNHKVTHQTDPGSDKGAVSSNHFVLEKNPSDQHYPYEKKADDDF